MPQVFCGLVGHDAPVQQVWAPPPQVSHMSDPGLHARGAAQEPPPGPGQQLVPSSPQAVQVPPKLYVKVAVQPTLLPQGFCPVRPHAPA